MKKQVFTGCKVNYYLKTIRRRADHYHEIRTVFQYLSTPGDTVTFDFDAVSGIRAYCDDPALPQDLGNLAGKAAARYAEAAGIAPCWEIAIQKGIPSAAGLGGGSADAGAVLKLLEEHYGLLGREKLLSLAAKLGADVPFFLTGGLALAEGIGEKIQQFSSTWLPPMLILNPGFPVSAKWAFEHLAPRRLAGDPDCGADKLLDALAEKDVHEMVRWMHNDLEYALFDKIPLLSIFRKSLLDAGALKVMVSGSGSSLFAVFADPEQRSAAAKSLQACYPKETLVKVFEV